MTFKPATWYPIAILLSVANVIGVGFATGALHATTHAALAVGFGLWAQRLGRARAGIAPQELDETTDTDRLQDLEDQLTGLRQELNETQERLDFTERMLAQRPDQRRVEPRP